MVTGKPTLLVDSSRIDLNYHPGGEITISKNTPFTLVHSGEINENGTGGGLAISPVALTNGSSESITESRKNGALANMERQFPNLKSLSASSTPDSQREIIWSRDLFANSILQKVSNSLTKLAYKVFPAK